MNKGIVSTGSKEATQAAADILRAGVNAVSIKDGFSDSRRGGTFEIV